jgi:hypothetical protein
MLAQSFKSAVELGITEPQRDALCKTLVLLETGKLEHAYSDINGFDATVRPKFDGLFNMGTWGTVSQRCGTVACIGGTAELIGNVSFGQLPHHNLPINLRKLFYATGVQSNWRDITPAQAATALRSYLTCGDAKWHEAIA